LRTPLRFRFFDECLNILSRDVLGTGNWAVTRVVSLYTHRRRQLETTASDKIKAAWDVFGKARFNHACKPEPKSTSSQVYLVLAEMTEVCGQSLKVFNNDVFLDVFILNSVFRNQN